MENFRWKKSGADPDNRIVNFDRFLDSILGGVSSQRRSHFERATRSLATFVRSHRSLRSLALQRFASLRSLTPFTGSLTHFAHSLVGQLKFLNMCSHCYRVSREQTRFWSTLETRHHCAIVGKWETHLDAHECS